MNRSYFWLVPPLLVSIVPAAWADQVGWGHGGHHMRGEGWHGWFFGPLMMVLSLAVVVAMVVLIARWLGGNNATAPNTRPGKEPLDILKERFAKGEIDDEEFSSRRRILEE